MRTASRKIKNSDFFIDYSNLDDFQRQLIDRKNNKSIVVSGSAGSGKSLIALHKAKQIASMNESFAIIVFTKTLRQYFSDGLNGLRLPINKVYYYNEWKKDKNKTRVKYLIVDECQDFTHEEIEELKGYANYCLFFGDTAQSIMNFRGEPQSIEDTAHELKVNPDPLYWNYRLTKEIASLAEEVGEVEDLVVKCKRQGEKPNLIEADSFDEQLDRIAETIRNRSLTNVGILLPFNTVKTGGDFSVEYVKDYLLEKGIPIEFKYNANMDTEMDLDFHSNNPKIMTYWCAKGLQFKDVFVPGCETEFEEEKRAALYVAITRCSERLHLCYTDDIDTFFPDTESDYYNHDNKKEVDKV